MQIASARSRDGTHPFGRILETSEKIHSTFARPPCELQWPSVASEGARCVEVASVLVPRRVPGPKWLGFFSRAAPPEICPQGGYDVATVVTGAIRCGPVCEVQRTMTQPRFSVIIPTKDRAETLAFCLDTCLAQQFADYEVVVCDNCSSEETRKVVEKANSSRIVYHRSDMPLLMADNWNLAFSLARGEYVIFLGDDDGLMPFALCQLDHILRATGVQAATWDVGVYTWPNILRADQANWLQFLVVRSLQVLDGRESIGHFLSGNAAPTLLPNIYHGVASRALLEEIRSSSGYIVVGVGPDTYSNFSVAYRAGKYARIGLPMSISGFSAASATGSFTLTNSKQGEARRTWDETQRSATNGLNPLLPNVLSPAVVVADSFLSAKRDIFPDDAALELDWKVLIDRILAHPPIDDLSEWPNIISELRRAFQERPELLAYLDEKLAQLEPKVPPRVDYVVRKRGFFGHHLSICAADRGVFDISAAIGLAARVLNIGEAPIAWSAQPTPDVDALRRMRGRLRDLPTGLTGEMAHLQDLEDQLHECQIEGINVSLHYEILQKDRKAVGEQYGILLKDHIHLGEQYEALLRDRVALGKQYEILYGEFLELSEAHSISDVGAG